MAKREKLKRIWHEMNRRCFDIHSAEYKRYGARGIVVDVKWMDFETFFEDMQKTYKKGLTLDRIDNNAHYSFENCKWATAKQQANNRRTNRLITYNGITQTLAQWIDALGLKSSTVRQRLYVYKWSIEKSFTFERGQSIG